MLEVGSWKLEVGDGNVGVWLPSPYEAWGLPSCWLRFFVQPYLTLFGQHSKTDKAGSGEMTRHLRMSKVSQLTVTLHADSAGQ